uniref:DUF565 domain-containing protein n=1 Tax=Cyanothece sp. (strain PCC 7425 / ATCC 29141) TaxID=395961 RepID=B8HYI1_CYAP4
MQNTRLSTLLDRLGTQFRQQLRNPWRRLSVLVMSLLFGVYLGTALASTAGQLGEIDIVASALVALVAEVISWLFYSDRWNFKATLFGEILNAVKFGVLYGLFLIAFLLGS